MLVSFKETTYRNRKKGEREKKNTDKTQAKVSACHVRGIM